MSEYCDGPQLTNVVRITCNIVLLDLDIVLMHLKLMQQNNITKNFTCFINAIMLISDRANNPKDNCFKIN